MNGDSRTPAGTTIDSCSSCLSPSTLIENIMSPGVPRRQTWVWGCYSLGSEFPFGKVFANLMRAVWVAMIIEVVATSSCSLYPLVRIESRPDREIQRDLPNDTKMRRAVGVSNCCHSRYSAMHCVMKDKVEVPI
jgi:hypothetical protein